MEKMQSSDKKLSKFLSLAQASQVQLEVAEAAKHDKIATEFFDGKKKLTKKFAVMAGVVKRMTEAPAAKASVEEEDEDEEE